MTTAWRYLRTRQLRDNRHVLLCAFDLVELNGQDLRREPIEIRKSELAKLLRNARAGLRLNEHIAEPGDIFAPPQLVRWETAPGRRGRRGLGWRPATLHEPAGGSTSL
jgi:hypothetical protein